MQRFNNFNDGINYDTKLLITGYVLQPISVLVCDFEWTCIGTMITVSFCSLKYTCWGVVHLVWRGKYFKCMLIDARSTLFTAQLHFTSLVHVHVYHIHVYINILDRLWAMNANNSDQDDAPQKGQPHPRSKL